MNDTALHTSAHTSDANQVNITQLESRTRNAKILPAAYERGQTTSDTELQTAQGWPSSQPFRQPARNKPKTTNVKQRSTRINKQGFDTR